MIKRILAIVFVYLCTTLAWVILGTTMSIRSTTQDEKLKNEVGQLWGTVQVQKAPSVFYVTKQDRRIETDRGPEVLTQTTEHFTPLDASRIAADLHLEHRQRGLMWYSTYGVNFAGKYRVKNNTSETHDFVFAFHFPIQQAVYDNFKISVGGKEIPNIELSSGEIRQTILLNPSQTAEIEIAYQTHGMDEWAYDFGSNVNQIKDFSLTMNTDFADIDFPQRSISPTEKTRTDKGWRLDWKYSNLLSGVQIGMLMPRKLNPGPWVSQVTFSAPVSLFLFFFLLFVFTTVKQIKIHPMNFFFLGAAFFSFHLLLSYLVDHLSIHISFAVCSAVSIFLVVSYMRLVVDRRFAFVEVGISQFIYLVLFSYTFFFEGYTGLAVTILCVITLFIVMQFTGRVDWEELFQKGGKRPN